jgi:hypothetical protein
MKKMIALMIVGIAMVGLSGCNGTSPGTSNDLTQVDALNDLGDGYILDGYDRNFDKLSIYFCDDRYVMMREPNDSFSGTFSPTEKLDILFHETKMNNQSRDERYTLFTGNDRGYIYTGNTYKFESTLSHQLTVEAITQETDPSVNYACE